MIYVERGRVASIAPVSAGSKGVMRDRGRRHSERTRPRIQKMDDRPIESPGPFLCASLHGEKVGDLGLKRDAGDTEPSGGLICVDQGVAINLTLQLRTMSLTTHHVIGRRTVVKPGWVASKPVGA